MFPSLYQCLSLRTSTWKSCFNIFMSGALIKLVCFVPSCSSGKWGLSFHQSGTNKIVRILDHYVYSIGICLWFLSPDTIQSVLYWLVFLLCHMVLVRWKVIWRLPRQKAVLLKKKMSSHLQMLSSHLWTSQLSIVWQRTKYKASPSCCIGNKHCVNRLLIFN